MTDYTEWKRAAEALIAADGPDAKPGDYAEADAEFGRHTSPTAILQLLEELERMREALRLSMRSNEMGAVILRDKRRTKATGKVADMVERIARHFDRLASIARSALEDR